MRLILAVAVCAALLSGLVHAQDSVVSTDKGDLRGTVATGYRVFLGIPYAAAPVGALRWQAPASVSAWPGVRDAKQAGNVCPQKNVSAADGTSSVRGAEDCLYLNVYTPYPPAARKKLPVMVWIHGGSFNFGAGSDYNAGVLAINANVVVVTINYRLGALGFLAHPQLTAEFADASGNYGFLDQQAALRWVNTNIAKFGGDAARTTIMGYSAGSASVCAHLISPASAGLFQRAIMHSGSCTAFGFSELAAVENTGTSFASLVGCTDASTATLSCLRGVSVESILSEQGKVSRPGATLVWSPTVGGGLLPQMPKKALAAGAFNKVPVLQGSNQNEGAFFVAQILHALQGLTAAQYVASINKYFGPAAEGMLAQYPAENYPAPAHAYSALMTDGTFSCPARTTDQLLAAHVDVFAYEFNDADAPVDLGSPYAPRVYPGFDLGAYHGSDVQYVIRAAEPSAFTPEQLALSNKMIRYWAQFAATGNPNGRAVPQWPRYNSAAEQFQLLTPRSVGRVDSFAADHKCLFWALLDSNR
jgi:para-nitrobenzyl esterase